MQFIWKMKSDGTQKTRLAYDPTKGEIRMPSWSRDGNKIVHIRYIGVGAPEVFLMDLNGYSPNRLTNNNQDDRYPQHVFEKKIAYWSAGYLLIMDSSGVDQIKVSDQQIDYLFSISPCENKVVYEKYAANDWTYENGTLWIINLVTEIKTQLTNHKPNN
jgi:dipeptidyl aminopeptidase/acylaminoacyl peptidase